MRLLSWYLTFAGSAARQAGFQFWRKGLSERLEDWTGAIEMARIPDPDDESM
jgi:hypothetical protein